MGTRDREATASSAATSANPAAGEKITARYKGSCSVCGGEFKVGSTIYWDKTTRKVRHADCNPATDTEAPITIHGQSEDKNESHRVGDVIHHREHGYLVVVNVSKKYYSAEDAMTFGLYNCPDGGYSFTYRCRPATAEEAEPLKQQEAVESLKRQHVRRFGKIKRRFKDEGERIESIPKEAEELHSFHQHKGMHRETFAADDNYLYFYEYNWMDGAYEESYRLPFDEGLKAELAVVMPTVLDEAEWDDLLAMTADAQLGIGVES